MKTAILRALTILVPSAYVISNKTVLTLHNFRFPSIFLSWQLSIALLVIILVYRQYVMTLSLSDLRSYVMGSIFLTMSLYFGSRALSVLPIPVFISGQILGTHVVKGIGNLGTTKSLGITVIAVQSLTTVFMLPLFILLLNRADSYIILCFLCHILSTCAMIGLGKTPSDLESTIKQAVVKIVVAISSLLLYGTLTGEVVKAGKYDFSKTHFKVYLMFSGVLSASTFVVRGWSFRSGKLQFRLVLQYVAVLIFGYWYDYNGDVTRNRDLLISFYFLFLLLVDTYLAKTSSVESTKTVPSDHV